MDAMDTMATLVSMTKTCSKCGTDKPLTEFYSRSDHPSSRPDCKVCVLARATVYRASNREKVRQSWRATTYRKKFGISLEQYNAMFTAQNGRCAICGIHQTEVTTKKAALAVDHNHATGEVRGLLCQHCNVGVGMFRESADVLERAIDYLLRFESGKDCESQKRLG